MRFIFKGKYIQVLPQEDVLNTDMLLGWRKPRNSPWYTVEDNLVNRLALNIPITNLTKNHADVQDTSGLMPFQIEDVNKTLGLQHFLNANPMGLGKTVETVRYLKEQNARNALIVCPKIIRYQWRDQLKKWGNFDAEVYEGQRGPLADDKIWIINYDKLPIERTQLKLRQFQWQFLILDEAHKIKNRTSARTIAVKKLPAQHRIALTGTPITRYVDDLWSILHFLDVSYSGISYWEFAKYFGKFVESEWGSNIVGLTDNPQKVEMLNKLFDLVGVRRKGIESAFGKTIEVVKLPMSKKQRELYKKEKDLALDSLPETLTIPNGAVLTLRLRQTTSWPGLYIQGEVGPKFEWILELCQNNPKQQIVVFSVFEQTVRALTKWLNANNVSTCCIAGTNKADINERYKRDFIARRAQVLVGTIGAMGQGYDGLQEVSSTVIFIDRDWSPSITEQAEDRLNRKGQTKTVNVYYLECQASFDQYVGRVNENKVEDMRKALNDV